MAKKRANGEGNIRKRADGRWEGRYTAGYRCLKELAHTAGFPLKSVGGVSKFHYPPRCHCARFAESGLRLRRSLSRFQYQSQAQRSGL